MADFGCPEKEIYCPPGGKNPKKAGNFNKPVLLTGYRQ
jgi:hypothetical protein